MMRRLLFLLIPLILLFCVSPAFAAEDDFEVRIDVSDREFAPGDTVTVTVYLNSKDGEGKTVYYLAGYFYYDDSCLELISKSADFGQEFLGPTTADGTQKKLHFIDFPWGGTLDIQAEQQLMEIKFKAKLPSGSTGGAGLFFADAVVQTVFQKEEKFSASPFRWQMPSEKQDPVMITPVFHCGGIAPEVVFLSGAGGYSPFGGFADAIAWGDDVTLYMPSFLSDQTTYDITVTCAGETLVGIPTEFASKNVYDVYTIPASLLAEDRELVITALPKVNASRIMTKTSVVDGSTVYAPYSVFTGERVLTLLDLPTDAEWAFGGDDPIGTLMKLPDGLYDGYSYCALVDLSHIDPTDTTAQLRYIKGNITVTEEAAEYTPSLDVNGKKGHVILDGIAVYDFATRTDLFWTPGITELLNADIDRDGIVTINDAVQLLESVFGK